MGKQIDFRQFDGRRFTTVDIEGLGTLTLATFSARDALEFRKLLKRQTAGEDVELEITRLMLVASMVDDEKKAAVFDDQAADAFLARASPEMVTQIVTEITKLLGTGQGDGKGNPSQPSPSGA